MILCRNKKELYLNYNRYCSTAKSFIGALLALHLYAGTATTLTHIDNFSRVV